MKNIFGKILVYCDKLIVGLLLALVVIVPLCFDIRLYSVFDLSKVTALYFLTLAILALWSIIVIFKKDYKLSRTALDVPILAYIFIFIISSITSINPIMSLLGTYKRFEGLTATVCYLLVFYATVNFVTTKKRLYLLIVLVLAGTTVSSCYGIAQHLGFDKFKWSSFEARRVFSTFGNPVFFSAYLIMTVPLAVVLFFSSPSQEREGSISKSSYIIWIFFVLSLIIYTAFWLTNTRACFIALLGGLSPLLFLISKKQTTERYKFVVLVISFILIGIFFNIRHETSVVKHFTSDVKTTNSRHEFLVNKGGLPTFDKRQIHQRPWITNNLSVAGSSFSRIFQYLAAIEIIKDHPVLGIGPDTTGVVYQRNLAKVFSVQESDSGFQFPRQDRIHNDILDITVTRGIFGIGTYVWLLIVFGVYVGRNYKQLSNQNKMLLLGPLVGILCYLIQNEFSFGNTPIVTLFWVMMGLCISIIKIGETEKGLKTEDGWKNRESRGWEEEKVGYSQPPNVSLFYKCLCCGIILTALGVASSFVLRAYRADAYFEYGRRLLAYERENLPTTIGKGLFFIEHAVQLNPYETFYRDELCRAYIQMAFATKDESWVQKAYVEANNSLRLIPQHYLGFFHLGIINQMLAERFNRNTRDQAIDYYKKAIEIDPFQATFHSSLASLYLKTENMDQAIEELYQAYLVRPAYLGRSEELNHVDRLANAYLQKGDLENALIYFRRTIELNPSEPAYYNNLGAVLYKKGIGEEAINSFKKAVTLKPDNPIYTHNLARIYIEMGKHTDAKDVLQTFNSTYPNHNYSNIHLLLANLYSTSTDWERVASECKEAIKIDEKSIAAYETLGIAYYNMKQYELAERTLNHVLTLDSNDQKAKDLLVAISNKIKK